MIHRRGKKTPRAAECSNGSLSRQGLAPGRRAAAPAQAAPAAPVPRGPGASPSPSNLLPSAKLDLQLLRRTGDGAAGTELPSDVPSDVPSQALFAQRDRRSCGFGWGFLTGFHSPRCRGLRVENKPFGLSYLRLPQILSLPPAGTDLSTRCGSHSRRTRGRCVCTPVFVQ